MQRGVDVLFLSSSSLCNFSYEYNTMIIRNKVRMIQCKMLSARFTREKVQPVTDLAYLWAIEHEEPPVETSDSIFLLLCSQVLKVTGYTFSRVKRALNILHCIIQTLFLMIIVLYSYEKLQWELQVKRQLVSCTFASCPGGEPHYVHFSVVKSCLGCTCQLFVLGIITFPRVSSSDRLKSFYPQGANLTSKAAGRGKFSVLER